MEGGSSGFLMGILDNGFKVGEGRFNMNSNGCNGDGG